MSQKSQIRNEISVLKLTKIISQNSCNKFFFGIHKLLPDGDNKRVMPISRNAEESREMIQNPRKNPDRHQNLIDSSFGHVPTGPPENVTL